MSMISNNSNDCTSLNQLGYEYEEITCLYPWLKSFSMNWEYDYNVAIAWAWMKDHPMVPIITVTLYVIAIVAGQKYMKHRAPCNLRKLMALWNLSLSLFSFIGVFKTGPQFFHNLLTMSIRENLCTDAQIHFGSGTCGVWSQFFIISKFPELFDTFFIVAHKKKLIFLHWYHHVSVLLFCWHSYVNKSPSGLFFIFMNYSVHAIMYGYYFLMAVKIKFRWFNPIIVTMAQISQMIFGVILTLMSFYFYNTSGEDYPCAIQRENNIAGSIIYGSYLFLFLDFFFWRYFKNTSIKLIKKTV